MLSFILLLHEYVARNLIPYYNLKFEAREAAGRFVYSWENRENECRHCTHVANEIGEYQTTHNRREMDRCFGYDTHSSSHPIDDIDQKV